MGIGNLKMSANELSMLSDELKPRRTPEPTSFQDFIPRPLVPDLSIIETPQSRPVSKLPTHSKSVPQPHHEAPPVNCTSYADWLSKTGKHETAVSDKSLRSHIHTNSYKSNASAHPRRPILSRLSDSAPPLGSSESAPLFQQSGTYTDFRKRPTSAPVERHQQSDGHVNIRPSVLHPSSVVPANISQKRLDERPQNAHSNAQYHQFPPSSTAVAENIAHQSVDPRFHNVNFGAGHQGLPTSSRLSKTKTQQRPQNVHNGARSHVSIASPVVSGNDVHHRGEQHISQNIPLYSRTSSNNSNGFEEMPLRYQQESLVPMNQIKGLNGYNQSMNPHLQNPQLFHITTPAEYVKSNPQPILNSGRPQQLVPHNHNSMLYPGQYFAHPPSNNNVHHCPSKCCCNQEHFADANHCGRSPLLTQQVPKSIDVQQTNVQSTSQTRVDKCGVEPNRASYDDLYRIVLAQSTQLKSLQAQVEKLLLSQEQQRCIHPGSLHDTNLPVPKALPSSEVHNHNGIMVTEDGTQTSTFESKPENCQKMSIGVMTSFIHAVAYSGRVGVVDAVSNATATQQTSSSQECSCQSCENSSSSTSAQSSLSSGSPSSPTQNQECQTNKCCKDCQTGKTQKRKTKLKLTEKPCERVEKAAEDCKNVHSKKSSVPTCPSGCNYNDPGVSAAISAVRGCQAVLASSAGLAVDDSFTFNAADIPTIAEQPVSPLSSIHVDIQDYRESSSDHSSSGSEDESHSEVDEDDEKENNCGSTEVNGRRGWTFYNNVLGQVNQIFQESEPGLIRKEQVNSVQSKENGILVPAKGSTDVVLPSSQKGTDVSATLKRVAFKAQEENEPSHNLKELALKYLRDNHPEELASNGYACGTPNSLGERVQDMAVYNMACGTNNMSFATFRYLERYNLLPENFNPQNIDAPPAMNGFRGNPTGVGLHSNTHDAIHVNPRSGAVPQPVPCRRKVRQADIHSSEAHHKPSTRRRHSKPANFHVHGHSPQRSSPLKGHHRNTPTSKILDITALRQQPKLL